MTKQTGDEFRAEMAWRSSFETDGRWGIPLMRKQPLASGDVDLLAYADTKPNDIEANTRRGVHFLLMTRVSRASTSIPSARSRSWPSIGSC